MRLFASWFYTPKKLKSFEYLNRVSVKSALNKRVEKSVVRIKNGLLFKAKVLFDIGRISYPYCSHAPKRS